ncbi:MAG: magnesium transporter [Chloroflexi bacterium]|nr:magnesium transporter [Chloroflexota bacterium]
MTLPETIDAEQLADRVAAGDAAAVAVELREQQPADAAEVINELPEHARAEILSHLSARDVSHLLEYLVRHGERALTPLARLPGGSLTAIFNRTPLGTAARVLREMPRELRSEIVDSLAERDIVRNLLAQDEETAGALVTTDFLALRERMTVMQAQATIRTSEILTRRLSHVYVVDNDDRLVGSVSFRQLLLSPQNLDLGRIMRRDPISVFAGTDQEECARIMERYRLDTLPTVDAEGRLLGFIDLPEVLRIAEGEATEDMYMIVGLSAEESVNTSIARSVRLRMPWLLVNLVTAFAAAAVVGMFESTIARAAILAAFLPIVGGQGGNAIIQTVTIAVRSIALGELTLRNARQVLVKETMLGLTHGAAMGVVAAVAVFLWSQELILSIALGVAMVINMLVAGAAGVLIPLILRRFGVDPALAAGIFGTTVTDVVGFGVLLALAAVSIGVLGL